MGLTDRYLIKQMCPKQVIKTSNAPDPMDLIIKQ